MGRRRRPWEFVSAPAMAVVAILGSCHQPEVVERRLPEDDGVPNVGVEIDDPGELAPGGG